MTKNYYNLFLDDVRLPKQVTWINLPLVEWTIVRNYSQFTTTILRDGLPQFISFDNDLAEEHYNPAMYSEDVNEYNKLYETFAEKTGYDCAKWLVEYCIEHNQPIPDYSVHSMNPIGKKNIISYIENFKTKM